MLGCSHTVVLRLPATAAHWWQALQWQVAGMPPVSVMLQQQLAPCITAAGTGVVQQCITAAGPYSNMHGFGNLSCMFLPTLVCCRLALWATEKSPASSSLQSPASLAPARCHCAPVRNCFVLARGRCCGSELICWWPGAKQSAWTAEAVVGACVCIMCVS